VNRWLATDEISAALARYHAVILSYTEASQSGIAALAAGHGVPVIANPVGGLVEQVVHGRGILARSPDASALAEAICELAGDCKLYNRILAALAESRERRSMRAFLSAILACIADVREAELAFDVG
jgi:glycosyltransferase involved in cell wall biosynthesis